MKFPTHRGPPRVHAEEVCFVMDHAEETWTQDQWAAELGVHWLTLRGWRRRGFRPGKYSAPTEERWDRLKAAAVGNVVRSLRLLDDKGIYLPSLVL